MLTGELRNQIDSIWNDFWSGGLANPLQVIEQITYLIFIKRLDEMQELEERKATTLGKPIERRIFPEGKDERGAGGGAVGVLLDRLVRGCLPVAPPPPERAQGLPVRL